MHGIDIKEDYLLGLGNGILDKLLLDRTTGENIICATDDYASMGDAYTFFKHITPELRWLTKERPMNFAEYCLGYCVLS